MASTNDLDCEARRQNRERWLAWIAYAVGGVLGLIASVFGPPAYFLLEWR